MYIYAACVYCIYAAEAIRYAKQKRARATVAAAAAAATCESTQLYQHRVHEIPLSLLVGGVTGTRFQKYFRKTHNYIVYIYITYI